MLKSCMTFLCSRTFRIQLAVGVFGLFLGFFILKFSLRQFTRFGDHIAVAEVIGLDRSSAESLLAAQGLEAIILDSIYDPRGRAGAVVDQDPKPLDAVKTGRKVYLTVYRSQPPRERIEVAEGMDAQVARIILGNKGFEFSEHYVATDDLAGLVVEVRQGASSLLPDDRQPRGAHLELVIGQSRRRSVELPNFTGLLLNDVLATIEELGLTAGRIEYETRDTAAAVVRSQQPEFVTGRRIALESLIDLTVLAPPAIDKYP